MPPTDGSVEYMPTSLVYHPPAQWTPITDGTVDEDDNTVSAEGDSDSGSSNSNTAAIVAGVVVAFVVVAAFVAGVVVYRRRKYAAVKREDSKSDQYNAGITPPESAEGSPEASENAVPVHLYEDPERRPAAHSVENIDLNAVRIHAN